MDPEVAPSPKAEDPDPGHSEHAASPGVRDKRRRVSGGEDAGLPPPSPKKPRGGGGDLGRVAEIVLVLSAMGRMRGGKDPTEVELRLMAEARERLAAICETLSPKDIVGGSAIGRVIEDLGLNGKAKDQRMGFRVPKLTIAEKLAFTRRKMEESKKHPTHTITYIAPSSQGDSSVGADNRGMLPTRTYQSDKPSQPPVSAGSFGPSPSPGYAVASAEKSTSITYHFGPNEVRTTTISSASSGTHLGNSSKVETLPDAVEIGSAPRTSIAQGILVAGPSVSQPLMSTSTWSMPAQPTPLSRFGSEKTALHHTSGKAHEASNMTVPLASPQDAGDQARRPHITRAAPDQPPSTYHQPLQSFTAASLNYSNHYEIVKIVQKFLPPKLPEHPTWTPPSREYMTKALSCQICQSTINDVESVLLCDACEKGYHLRCLQSQNQRGIPKVEWHCQKCLALSHGKPLPPKYGRVMRNTATPKVAANVTNAQTYFEKKLGTADSKASQQKLTSSLSFGSHNPSAGAALITSHAKFSSDGQLPKGRDIEENTPSAGAEMQQKSSSQCITNNSMIYIGSAFGYSDGIFNEKCVEDENKCELCTDEERSAFQGKFETFANESDLSSSFHNPSNEKGTKPAQYGGDHPQACENTVSERKEAGNSYANDGGGSNIGVIKQEQTCAETNIDSTTENDVNQENSCAQENADFSTGSIAHKEQFCAETNIDSITERNVNQENSYVQENADFSTGSYAQKEKSHADDDISNTGLIHQQEKSVKEEDCCDSNTRSEIKQDCEDIGQQVPSLSSVADASFREDSTLVSDATQSAQWLGDVLELVDGKTFYGSCCIDGVTYKLNQYALFYSHQGKLVPSKLKAMWEDKNTGLKCVKVNRCYHPGDLPENVAHPFTETNEIFESNHEEIYLIRMIQGPCEVLHSTKYKEQAMRRNLEADAGLTPIFLCKWFYDASKGHFHAVSY
ncbi:hypothetical protein SAY87_031665 [Trapa incisa]|uniref:PHD-type domain-containing protein n=1 Tax=Trapa incisa TaxID=236973 RepID=A0AAN7KKY5_9MYRT|nr:hypothetical protein SAY87_031665 [Trapa incisa]